jgi:copper homeostasis protein
MKKRPLLEVCVDTPAGLLAAVGAGADRIELCAALPLAGLTPSLGLMRLAAAQPVPSYAMIRPRTGDFVYDAADLDVMRRDIDAAREAGLPGVVFGAGHRSGALDENTLARLLGHAKGLRATLHRAFDLAPDLPAALETAVALGFERVLTSGGANTAPAGAARIADLNAQAGGRIAIMAGAGVTAANAAELMRRTGVVELHASCSASAHVDDPDGRMVELGFLPPAMRETDAEAVRALAAAIRGA